MMMNKVRCKISQYCDDYGAFIVVTDYGEGDRTDFILSPRAYSRLGKNEDASAELFKYGVVDVEYKRVPCRYGGYNVVVKVHERSYNPHYLAILILYVGGTYDITAVQLWQVYRHAFIDLSLNLIIKVALRYKTCPISIFHICLHIGVYIQLLYLKLNWVSLKH